jgi:sugar transferase (PEP-CTERM/EpsH1 system associated)
MNILIVASKIPYPLWGAGTRNYYLLRSLARHHNISLLALASSSEIQSDYTANLQKYITGTFRLFSPVSASKRREQLLHMLRGTSYTLASYQLPAIQQALDELFTREEYDVVLFESSLIAGYHLPPGVKVIIDEHNIEYELLRRSYQREKQWLRKWYNWQESRLVEAAELERCRNANAVTVTSQRELSLLQGKLPQSTIEVVPNGVDIEYFNGDTLHEIPGRIIFTGSLEYYPNVDAVLFFAKHCWPLIQARYPDATWQIVGKNPLPVVQQLAKLSGISVFGPVDDTRPYIAAAQVAIAPLLIGSGTRLKILEAFAMRKAVVSTSIGCEGLQVEPAKHLLIADQAEAFAQAVIDLLGNQAQRQALGTAGRMLVESTYSWERCGDRLLAVLTRLNSDVII